MKDLLHIASILDNSGQFNLSDKLFKIAQQGRLNLDKQVGVEDFRNELKKLIGQALVRDNILKKEYYTGNPLNFHIDFNKLNSLLRNSYLGFYVSEIRDIKMVYADYIAANKAIPEAVIDPINKNIYIPAEYNSKNFKAFVHEIVHAIDPQLINDNHYSSRNRMDHQRPYYSQDKERLAFFEQLDEFFESDKLKKVLEIFYIKDKKKYPTKEFATKAFLDDFKNYMQNPLESMLFNKSRFHSYLIAANNGAHGFITDLLFNLYEPLNTEEFQKLFGDIDQKSAKGYELMTAYFKKHPERRKLRDNHYFNQLNKLFTNVYLNVSKEIMPSYKAPVKPFNLNTTIKMEGPKSWLASNLTKRTTTSYEQAIKAIDFLTYHRRDLYNKFISTLRTLNIVLDESFNFQDPRWQLLEPIVEILMNELIKYLENPKQYKTNLTTDEQRITKQLNEEITKIINDKTIKDKKTYFLEHWGDSLKKLGTLEQHELLSKFPIMSLDQGLQMMKNIGQK